MNKEKIEQVLNDISNSKIIDIQYRPFDNRKTLFSKNSEGVLWRPRYSTMVHFEKQNIGLIAKRGFSENNSAPCFISSFILDRRGWSRPGMQGAESLFPLYLYSENKDQQYIDQSTGRTPNLNMEIVNQIAEKLALRFTDEKELTEGTLAPIDILDYIYAILHSPTYREKYKEFLKIDFPRVPYPQDAETFWHLVKLGGELRQIHLLESPVVEKRITTYPQSGENIVDKPRFDNGKVWINKEQYFDNVPKIAWEFYIGGYQPAQKWLKDRKGRQLNFDDIMHYQKIIAALSETDAIMKKIDEIAFI